MTRADGYDTELKPQKLSQQVEGRREEAMRQASLVARTVDPCIAAHLDGAEKVLEVVAAAERHIAEETDLDLSGDTRQVAVWLLIGRLVGLARAAIELLRQGFSAEVAPTLRVMHETTRILHAIVDPDEADLLHRWLEDTAAYIRPREAREAGDRTRLRQAPNLETLLGQARAAGEDELAAQLEAALEELRLDVGDDLLTGISRQIYDKLSRISHSRRSGMADSFSVPLRTIIVGPHSDPTMRAWYVALAGELIEETLIACSDGLSSAFWPTYHTQQAQPLIKAFRALRDANPLQQ